jgi:polyhydroxyalkanoate synthesis repressor PhaR
MLVVKKYPNRRLYDTKASRYITLEDLAEMVRGGTDVIVQDAQTGADLTQATLTQIILESRGGARLLPVPLLVRLIRMGDEALAEFLGRYVSWALELYVGAKQGARALLPLNPLATAPFAATDALARMLLGAAPWGSGQAAAAAPAPPAPPPPPPSEPAAAEPEPSLVHREVEDVAQQMARLRREIEELKRTAFAAAGEGAPARKKTKAKARARKR